MISPACGIELVEVVGCGRVGIDLLVEVFLPGRGKDKKKEVALLYNRRAILIRPLASFPRTLSSKSGMKLF